MRTLVRLGTLAALCALLLSFSSVVQAGVPGRPIDTPDGGPAPVQVGDPDEPPSLVIVPFINRVFLVKLPLGIRQALALPSYAPTRRPLGLSPKRAGARNAH